MFSITHEFRIRVTGFKRRQPELPGRWPARAGRELRQSKPGSELEGGGRGGGGRVVAVEGGGARSGPTGGERERGGARV